MNLLTGNYKKEKASICGDFCDPEAITKAVFISYFMFY